MDVTHGMTDLTHAMQSTGSVDHTRSDIVSVGLGYSPNLLGPNHLVNGCNAGVGGSPRGRSFASVPMLGATVHSGAMTGPGSLLALHNEGGVDGWARNSGVYC